MRGNSDRSPGSRRGVTQDDCSPTPSSSAWHMDHPIPQDLREQIDRVQRDALLEIGSAENLPALESLRIKYLSRKGIVAHHFELLGGAPPELRPGLGKRLNEMRSSRSEERRVGKECRSR